MILKILLNTLLFLSLMVVQTLVLNHIQWSGYLNPYMYILFILLLPSDTPRWLLLILAFITGIVMDIFGNTSGLHAAATVLLAYCRPAVMRMLAPRDDYEPEVPLTPQRMGLKWFLAYVAILTLIHHLFYFYIEVFRMNEFFITFFKAILNSVVTVMLMLIGLYVFGKRGKANERIFG